MERCGIKFQIGKILATCLLFNFTQVVLNFKSIVFTSTWVKIEFYLGEIKPTLVK